jgi:hypothetical protein
MCENMNAGIDTDVMLGHWGYKTGRGDEAGISNLGVNKNSTNKKRLA